MAAPSPAASAALKPKAKRLLMVAYHYPPAGFSSGIHRSLCFANDLVDHGWQPCVLTVTTHAYPKVFPDTLARIRAEVEVLRCPAFDSARALSIGGRYPRGVALPDRWSSWILSGVARGLIAIRKQRPAAIWSTYPIASAHLIALLLQRLTGLPWIADFRDPMLDEHFPANRWQRRCHAWIETQVMRHASLAVFTTEATRLAFKHQYPEYGGFKAATAVIANGFDAALFESPLEYRFGGDRVGLLHSGLLDPADRPPLGLLTAIAELNAGMDAEQEKATVAARVPFKLGLRASGHDEQLRQLIAQAKVAEQVDLLPPLPYQQAIDEMRLSDILVLLQGASCPHQVPAKLYEYIRSGRPILGLCDLAGETAQQLRQAGVTTLVSPEEIPAIKQALAQLRSKVIANEATGVDPLFADRYDRRHGSEKLAQLLEPFLASRS